MLLLLLSCFSPTLCDPKDGSSPGSPIPGILQARTLEWVAVSSSNAWKWKVKVKSLSRTSCPKNVEWKHGDLRLVGCTGGEDSSPQGGGVAIPEASGSRLAAALGWECKWATLSGVWFALWRPCSQVTLGLLLLLIWSDGTCLTLDWSFPCYFSSCFTHSLLLKCVQPDTSTQHVPYPVVTISLGGFMIFYLQLCCFRS